MKAKITQVIFRDYTKMSSKEKGLAIKALCFLALAILSLGLGGMLGTHYISFPLFFVFITIGVIYQAKRYIATRTVLENEKEDD